jgi:hypothetical protein
VPFQNYPRGYLSNETGERAVYLQLTRHDSGRLKVAGTEFKVIYRRYILPLDCKVICRAIAPVSKRI